jgi:hypothetical protein
MLRLMHRFGMHTHQTDFIAVGNRSGNGMRWITSRYQSSRRNLGFECKCCNKCRIAVGRSLVCCVRHGDGMDGRDGEELCH